MSCAFSCRLVNRYFNRLPAQISFATARAMLNRDAQEPVFVLWRGRSQAFARCGGPCIRRAQRRSAPGPRTEWQQDVEKLGKLRESDHPARDAARIARACAAAGGGRS